MRVRNRVRVLASPSTPSLLRGLVSWWGANETRGTRDVVMLDATGQHHLGTSGNPSQATGAISTGNAIKFTGGTQFATSPVGIGVDWSKNWTVAFWGKTTATGISAFVGRWTNTASNASWAYMSNNGTGTRFYSGGLAGTAVNILGTAPTLTLNQWHHIIIQHDSASNRVVIFRDGVPTLINADANIANFDLPFTIGTAGRPNDGFQSGSHWAGNCEMDEIGVWSRLLTEQERSILHNEGNGIPYPGTVYTIPTRPVYPISGQSNADGRGTNRQTYTGSGGLMLTFEGVHWPQTNYALVPIEDPVGTGSGATLGSVWPLFANEVGGPLVLAPYAIGGTAISIWAKSGISCNRGNRFGAICYRSQIASAHGQLTPVLWWQGESDVLAGTAQATYQAALESLADNFASDIGVGLKPALLQAMNTGTYPQINQDAINQAIIDATAANANITAGPDLRGLSAVTLGDGVHIQSDSGLASAAALWAATI
jgi:hypothetical protein